MNYPASPHPGRRRLLGAGLAGAGLFASFLATGPVAARADTAPLRIGVLRFGSVSWELDVIARHGLAAGIAIQPVSLAASQAAQVALQAGSVDMIVQDWLWVARLRAAGQDWTFAPLSAAVGALMAAPDGPVHDVGDLAGKRLGVAGSPLDKSWLFLRAYAKASKGIDLEQATTHSFAAPPLLSEELRQGRLDAVLTYWPEAARLKGHGMRQVLTVQDAVAGLGVAGVGADERVPMTGYVFSRRWGAAHPDALRAFLAASAKAQALLAQSDAEWRTLQPLTGAKDAAELAALRDAYRAGIPEAFGPATLTQVEGLYAVLASIGGKALVGDAARLPPGTFWTEAT